MKKLQLMSHYPTSLWIDLHVLHTVVAEAGASATFGHMDVDISEAGEGWGDEDIIIDEGLVAVVLKFSLYMWVFLQFCANYLRYCCHRCNWSTHYLVSCHTVNDI